MDVKAAVHTALEYVSDLFRDTQLYDLGLEEVTFDDAAGIWEVTVGFSRAWDYPKHSPFTSVIAGNVPKRNYKIVRVKDSDGHVESVKIRELTG